MRVSALFRISVRITAFARISRRRRMRRRRGRARACPHVPKQLVHGIAQPVTIAFNPTTRSLLIVFCGNVLPCCCFYRYLGCRCCRYWCYCCVVYFTASNVVVVLYTLLPATLLLLLLLILLFLLLRLCCCSVICSYWRCFHLLPLFLSLLPLL